jgi:peptide chain release factor 1
LDDSLNRVLRRYDELEQLVASHPKPGSPAHTEMLKEYSDLTPVVQGIEALRGAQHEMADLAELIADPASDAEMRNLAETEFHELKEKLPDLEQDLKILLLPKDEADDRNAILEVRAGTGGDEAALFAADLMRMDVSRIV